MRIYRLRLGMAYANGAYLSQRIIAISQEQMVLRMIQDFFPVFVSTLLQTKPKEKKVGRLSSVASKFFAFGSMLDKMRWVNGKIR